MLKSFIDVLFILLICTVVLLSESMRIDALPLHPPTVAAAGESMVQSEPERLVSVGVLAEGLVLADNPEPYPSVGKLVEAIRAQPQDQEEQPSGQGQPILLLSPAEEGMSHDRMMKVWSRLHQAGYEVRLGVRPEAMEPETQPQAEPKANPKDEQAPQPRQPRS